MDRRRAGLPVAALFATGVAALWLSVDGVVPPFGAVAALAFFAGATAVRTRSPERARRSAAFWTATGLALSVIAVALRPLAGRALPDVGVLGPYTYLATEVAFGGAALALLVRAGPDALGRAVRTVAVIYPLAYVWDWYTLEVGVFEIPLRTGVELVGIPLEEHLFMVVVPALVLGVHETVHRDTDRG
ncbi:MAG: lycopene cyclase domain-containing protein [Halosimplex sp.]